MYVSKRLTLFTLVPTQVNKFYLFESRSQMKTTIVQIGMFIGLSVLLENDGRKCVTTQGFGKTANRLLKTFLIWCRRTFLVKQQI